jgi:putative transposase
MKGKRYTTEDKIWILREADRGEQTIQVICRKANISEVTFHRWKKQFGQLEVNEARRLKESLLKNRVLEAVCDLWSGPAGGGCGDVLATGGLPDPARGALDLPLSGTGSHDGGAAVEETAARVVGGTPALRVSADRGLVTAGRLAGGQAAHPTAAAAFGGVCHFFSSVTRRRIHMLRSPSEPNWGGG